MRSGSRLGAVALAGLCGLFDLSCRRAPFADGEARHAIDLHTHVELGTTGAAVDAWRASGIEAAAVLVGRPHGELLLAHLAEARQVMAAQPGFRLWIYAGVDWQALGQPDFGELAAENLRRAHAAGARGLKVFKSLGLGVRTADGRLLAVDDPVLDPLWRTAGELDMPVSIHTGDPAAFFAPPNPDNERWEELSAHPSWSFYGGDFPSLEALLAARDRLVARHPQTTFVAVHFGGFPENPDAVAAALRKLPNLWIDLAARLPEIGRRDPRALRAFFLEFQDRILLGTDLQVGAEYVVLGSHGPDDDYGLSDIPRYYQVHWRFLETEDPAIEHLTPIQGRWTIRGIGLPRSVLDKIYRGNARRLLHLERE